MKYTNRKDLQEQLEHLRSKDIRSIDPDNISELSEIEIDRNLPAKERVKTLLMQTQNPYVYKVNGMVVKISFSENFILSPLFLFIFILFPLNQIRPHREQYR